MLGIRSGAVPLVEPESFPLWPDNPTSLDLLGFSDIASPIVSAVERERLDPVAVGVFGDWGCGKTTILELIDASYDERDDVIVVFTHPWEYDPTLDPRASLIAEVLGAVRAFAEKDSTRWDEVKDKFDKLAKRIEWSKAFTVATKSALTFTLPSIDSLVGIFSGASSEAGDPSLQGFRDEFASLMGELSDVKRVVVLVDDLDRCLPETVVMTLEAIKLFLSVEKMAFVLAADARLVELAISHRFGITEQGGRMAREYLEKIVQIPVSVPALGEGDTEAYLALMLLSHHLGDDGDVFGKLIAHCDERRGRADARVLKDLPEGLVPETAKSDLALAAMLAPILSEKLDGNPRRLKRFLNAFWMRLAIARLRGAAPDEAALAKLMVLEQLEPDAFAQMLDWLSDGSLPEKLVAIESGDVPEGVHSVFESWGKMTPKLAALDLGPYLRLAASLRRRPGATSDLRSDLAELLDGLQSDALTDRTSAQTRLKELPAPDRLIMAREVVNRMRVDPTGSKHLVEAFAQLSVDEQLTAELVGALRTLDPARVDSGLIIEMGGGGPAAEQMRALLREWKEGGQLGAVQAAAADEVLEAGA